MSEILLSIEMHEIQGNILKGHGREHVRCLFLGFGGDVAVVRNWVRQFASHVTSAQDQKDAAINRKKNDSVMQVGMYLSASGYRKLGFNTGQMPNDPSFRLGMKDGQVNGPLGDPPVAQWEPSYQRTLDAMILFANKHEQLLKKDLDQELAASLLALESSGAGRLLFEERGSILPPGRPVQEAVEHFGFRDGNIPKDMVGDAPKITIAENGSYLVFRKLEQNVEAFNSEIKRIALGLGLDPGSENDLEFVRAQVIGRFRNGDRFDLKATNFRTKKEYQFEGKDNRCPFHAHIHKVRPGVDGTLDIRIVRRGITYGNRASDLSDQPPGGVGLLFMCFQKSIAGQFEHIQKNWANQKNFVSPDKTPGSVTGIDPIVGWQFTDSKQPWRRKQENQKPVRRKFRQVVKLMGGEYFYAPPKSFLNNPVPTQSKEDVSPGNPRPAYRYRNASGVYRR